MNLQEYRNLQEAYIGVYNDDIREKLEFESWVNNLLEEGYDLSDYTWDELYENYSQLDEAFKPLPTEKLDNKTKKLAVSSDPDSGRRQGNIGRVRSNIGKSQKTQSFGSTESQKRKSAKHHAKSYLRQNRHSTQDTKDKPDLYTRAVGYYIDRGEDAKKKHLQRMNKEQVDLYNVIFSHLLDEGYADSNDSALSIMANMSEEWRESIMEEKKPLPVAKMKKKEEQLDRELGEVPTISRIQSMSSSEINEFKRKNRRFGNMHDVRRSVSTRGGWRPLDMPEVGRFKPKD